MGDGLAKHRADPQVCNANVDLFLRMEDYPDAIRRKVPRRMPVGLAIAPNGQHHSALSASDFLTNLPGALRLPEGHFGNGRRIARFAPPNPSL